MIEVQNLKKYFDVTEKTLLNAFSKEVKYLKAVDGVSLTVKQGETLGLVGESGCGKTTLGRTIIRLMKPTAGRIIFDGKDTAAFDEADSKTFCKRVQMIFQDPFSSLNSRKKVFSIVTEGLKIHNMLKTSELKDRAKHLLDIVGLSEEHLDRYPHEFSGGQRQRIGISRAISLEPEFVICDEPVSSLDVSVQAQIINLLLDLQEKYNLGYLFITHDLSVVKYISHKIAVMYAGRIVEFADTKELFSCPLHPYTKKLLAALPEMKSANVKTSGDESGPYLLEQDIKGCPFRSRCGQAKQECSESCAELKTVKEGHQVACINI